MKKYILLGSNNPNPSKHNLKAVCASDNLDELKTIWENINDFYLEIGDTFNGKLNKKATSMIEKDKYLNDLFDIYLESIIWRVEIIGIFESVAVNPSQTDLLS